jgi:branched-chain amino acid transport system permease protein
VTEIFRQLEKGVTLTNGITAQIPLGVQEIVLGAVMLVILIYRPQGLTRGREVPWPFGAPRPASGPAATSIPAAGRGP